MTLREVSKKLGIQSSVLRRVVKNGYLPREYLSGDTASDKYDFDEEAALVLAIAAVLHLAGMRELAVLSILRKARRRVSSGARLLVVDLDDNRLVQLRLSLEEFQKRLKR